jgi:putative hydrolase
VRHRTEAKANNLEILRLCKKYEVHVIVGSDAHISFDIGTHQLVDELLQESEFPDELIVNDKIELFKQILRKGK